MKREVGAGRRAVCMATAERRGREGKCWVEVRACLTIARMT